MNTERGNVEEQQRTPNHSTEENNEECKLTVGAKSFPPPLHEVCCQSPRKQKNPSNPHSGEAREAFHETSPRCPEDPRNILNNIPPEPETSPKHPRTIPETSPKHPRIILETSSKHPLTLKHLRNILETSSKHPLTPKHLRNISETSPKHPRNILRNIVRNIPSNIPTIP